MPLLPFAPDLALLALAILILTADAFEETGSLTFHLAWSGLLAIVLLLICMPTGMAATASFAGYQGSPALGIWKLIFTLAGLGTVLVSRSYFQTGGNLRGTLNKSGAFYALLILCMQGMFALVSARDLLVFYLGLELATLPLYALAAFQSRDAHSVESGSKFVLMGGFSSALSLFGLSFLFGCAGSLGFDALANAAHSMPSEPLLWGGVFFLLGGLGFKLAMVPFHMWAPDIYEGAPTPVMAFLSVGSKAAAVAALSLLFFGPLNALRPGLEIFFSVVAVLSMVAGNLGAMRQKDLRRFVAYSSIAQVGTMLLAMLGDSNTGRAALQYNLIVYGATSFALYFVMGVIGKDAPETIPSLRGLSQRSPGLAALLLLCMFSLAGIPPMAGFLGKFQLFSVAAASGHYWLVGIAVAMAVVSFYYYMLIVKEAYIVEAGMPSGKGLAPPPLILTAGQKIALWGLAILLLLLGTVPTVSQWIGARSGM